MKAAKNFLDEIQNVCGAGSQKYYDFLDELKCFQFGR